MSTPRETVWDTIVIGGGVSGLAAADALAQAGRSYVVLEAQTSLGGRARTGSEVHGFIDLGAAYIGEQQNFLNMYLQRFGVETFKVHELEQEAWLYQHADGEVESLPGDDPYALPGRAAAERALSVMFLLNQLSLQVRAVAGRPWAALNARQWDQMSLGDWMDRNLPGPEDRLTRELLCAAVRAAYSTEPRDLSFLWFLHYAGTAGCFQNLVGVTSNPEGRRFRYGSRAFIDALADAVGRDAIRLGEPVRKLGQDEAGVRVETDRGSYRARAAIVCMSPVNSLRLTYSPALAELPGGPEREELCRNMPMGHIIKVFVHFKRPFWYAQNRSGYSLTGGDRLESRPLVWTLDNCWEGPADAGVTHPHSLMGFIVADKAKYWSQRSRTERREAVLAQLCELFGAEARTELLDGDDYTEMDWSRDEWAGGAPCGHARPGALTSCGDSLRRPVGRVYWAAAELATEWAGYLSGAIESGLAAAADVEALLSSERARAR
jgi:monoamine oxidase